MINLMRAHVKEICQWHGGNKGGYAYWGFWSSSHKLISKLERDYSSVKASVIIFNELSSVFSSLHSYLIFPSINLANRVKTHLPSAWKVPESNPAVS